MIIVAEFRQLSQGLEVASQAGLVHPTLVERRLVKVNHLEGIQVEGTVEASLPVRALDIRKANSFIESLALLAFQECLPSSLAASIPTLQARSFHMP